MTGARGPRRPARVALALALLVLGQPARAVEEDAVGWWIYLGSVRSTLIARYIGPESAVPDAVAAEWAARACGLRVRVDRLDPFRETPVGDEPLVIGPFLDRGRVAAALACVRRGVPAAFVTRPRPPD